MNKFIDCKKLIFKISFFFVTLFVSNAQALKSGSAGSLISTHFQLSGDLKGSIQFSGHLGTQLDGQIIEMSSPCLATGYFRQVNYQKKNKIEVTLSLTCTGKQQESEKFTPPRFFIDTKVPTAQVDFVNLSSTFKKIHVELTETKISQKQAK